MNGRTVSDTAGCQAERAPTLEHRTPARDMARAAPLAFGRPRFVGDSSRRLRTLWKRGDKVKEGARGGTSGCPAL
jgi:hypothetical protein